jgi:hypothetical protein
VCGVEVNIRARTERVWSLLTDAKDFSRWNSTVASIEGRIGEGERLRLRVPGTARTFTPRVSGVVLNERMIWTGGFAPVFKGVRTFEPWPRSDGSTDFAMEERFSGLMLPLVKGSLPDFGPVLERYANDLKREAERATTPAWYGLTCFTAMIVGMSFVFAWMRLRSGSLWTGMILHGSHNLFVQTVFDPFTTDRTDQVRYGRVWAALAIAAVGAAVIAWRARKAVEGVGRSGGESEGAA